jgi:hypothetical protein
MRLPRPFFRLPLRFDAARLAHEVAALPADAWAPHPNRIAGNHSVRLISTGGGENDDVHGPMLPTAHLARCPYLRQVLASFGVVWSRSRLLRLEPGAIVPGHSDINHHWFFRVRVHVPVITRPEVLFHCGGETVHMGAGEAWVFDNWRQHSVENPTADERIHLVADTSGSSEFWRMVASSNGAPVRDLAFDATADAQPLTERTGSPIVLPPAEVELLVYDLRAELATDGGAPADRARVARYQALLNAFARDWRQLHALHGEHPDGLDEYRRLIDAVRNASRELGEGIHLSSNRVAAHQVLEGRVLRAAVRSAPAPAAARPGAASAAPAVASIAPAANVRRVDRPVFLIAAPRSGSTLLFETLARSETLRTVGGEAHWLVEDIAELRPDGRYVDSNRLEARHATPAIAERIARTLVERLVDAEGAPLPPGDGPVRVLEKTPKNALRIPFFASIFPDARFVFLWRDPRPNVASIIAAWRSGRWKTYNGLDGFDGPWSLLLPPGWRAMNGRPLEEIAAFQWNAANATALDDLASLPDARWTSVRYEDLVASPATTVRRLCEFADVPFDAALAARLAAPLPASRYTLTPPDPDKWKRDEAAVLRVLPGLEATWARLRQLPQ